MPLEMELPEILDLPDKLLPCIYQINDYDYWLLHGGRGGGKSQSIARLILWICEQRTVRVCCGRETQNTIEDSVYRILVDIIGEYELDFDVYNNRIEHRRTGSTIIFRGFKEQGRVNIKGLEGIDILWIDEAEAITKATLDIIVPTIRKNDAIVYFTMNRNVRKDAVFVEFAKDPDCKVIKINYYDNKHCPDNLIKKALKCKKTNPADYDHIWEGNPLDQASDYLVSSSKLDKAAKLENIPKEQYRKIKCMAVDLSGNGGDLCVATLTESISNLHFKASQREDWNEPDTDITKGKIISLYSRWQPDILILDADGMGYPIYVSVKKAIPKCLAFHGQGKSFRQNAFNQRADGYLTLKDFIDNEWLEIPQDDTRDQIEFTKKEYRANGTVIIQKKEELKEEIGESPDKADSLMMSIYGLNYYSYMADAKGDEDEVVFMDTSYDPFDN
ncbi:MAG: PBSX family phage terminase large subunit [Candidatus Melainabacteria bacterium]|nr:MAG: PBSX family phage terminase large subunit [Candidatus Melainabacteria bacterium]